MIKLFSGIQDFINSNLFTPNYQEDFICAFTISSTDTFFSCKNCILLNVVGLCQLNEQIFKSLEAIHLKSDHSVNDSSKKKLNLENFQQNKYKTLQLLGNSSASTNSQISGKLKKKLFNNKCEFDKTITNCKCCLI